MRSNLFWWEKCPADELFIEEYEKLDRKNRYRVDAIIEHLIQDAQWGKQARIGVKWKNAIVWIIPFRTPTADIKICWSEGSQGVLLHALLVSEAP